MPFTLDEPFAPHARNLSRTIDKVLDKAEDLATRGKLCEAHSLLVGAMQRLQELREKRHADASAIDLGYAEISGVARDIAKRAADRGLACGSAAGDGQPPTVNLSTSDNRTLKGTVGFGPAVFSATLEGQTAYTSVSVEGVPNEESGAIGTPALPIPDHASGSRLEGVFGRPPLPLPDPAPVLRVSYPIDGVTLTALASDPVVGFKPIARGVVSNGEAILSGFFDELDGTPIDYFSLRYSATIENGVSVRVRSDVEEPN